MSRVAVLCLLLASIQTGCRRHWTHHKRLAEHPNPPTQRFALTQDIDLAFDTQTGQLCRTWDWTAVAQKLKPTDKGLVPQYKPGQNTSTCLSLYQQVPTAGNPQDPLGLLDKNGKVK